MNENKRGVAECPFDSSLDSQGQRTSAGPVGEGGGGETGTDFSSTYDLYYDPPTHLREGNVFIRVCLSTFKHGTSETPLAMAPSDTGPPLRHGTSRTPTPARPHW